MVEWERIQRTLRSSKFFNHGVPLLLFCVGGSFVLSQFTDIRYKVAAHKNMFGLTPEMAEKHGIKFREQADIDEEYRKMKETLDLNNWKNIRAPRPYEDNKEYNELVEKLKEKNKDKPLNLFKAQ